MKSSNRKILSFLVVLFLIGLAFAIDIWLHGCVSPSLGTGEKICGDSAKEEAYGVFGVVAITSLIFLGKRWINRKDGSQL